jgi:3-hydroxyisobutyrate dehydrogenase-like beta-hydroxyacid dehydrogenase
MKIGFIGLGRMGSGMAANLVKAGNDVTVYNRTQGKDRELVAQGTHSASNVADACKGDAVITMLADDNALESIAFGEQGIIKNLRKGAIHISMSTISVAISEKLTEAHAKAGQRYLSAPVFGRPDAAAAGKLFIVAGGARADIDSCQPMFDVLGQKTFTLSDKPSAANLVKLSGNFLIGAAMEAMGEALALVGKGGVDQQQYLDLMTSTLFTSPIYKNYGALIVERKFEPAGFATPLGYKDMRLLLAAADGLRVPMPLGSLLRDRLLRILAQGGETLDWSAIGYLSAKDSGQNGR